MRFRHDKGRGNRRHVIHLRIASVQKQSPICTWGTFRQFPGIPAAGSGRVGFAVAGSRRGRRRSSHHAGDEDEPGVPRVHPVAHRGVGGGKALDDNYLKVLRALSALLHPHLRYVARPQLERPAVDTGCAIAAEMMPLRGVPIMMESTEIGRAIKEVVA